MITEINSVANFLVLGATATRTQGLSSVQVFDVFRTSVTANWLPLPATPQNATAEGYRLEASEAADFAATVSVSSTPDVALSTLSATGLSANTTYYLRAGGLNWASSSNFGARAGRGSWPRTS